MSKGFTRFCWLLNDRRSGLGRGREIVLLVAALALVWCFPPPIHAQTGQAKDAGESTSQAVAACEHDPRSVLWRVAQSCSKDLKSDPNCRVYTRDGEEEYAIVKDRNTSEKPANYLMIPVKCVTGIEDAQIFSSALAELWREAWLWSGKYPGVPAPRTGLAINSKQARSQNQLHIHISCVRADVASLLASKQIPFFPAKGVDVRLKPDNHLYRAVKVGSLGGESSPFRVLTAMLGRKEVREVKDGELQDQSVAVIGSERPNEFYVLATTAEGDNNGHAEELLDQTCQ